MNGLVPYVQERPLRYFIDWGVFLGLASGLCIALTVYMCQAVS